jgi:hypothetical protein
LIAVPRAAVPVAKSFATQATPSVVSTTANVSPLAPRPSGSPSTYRAGNADASTKLAADTHKSYCNHKKNKASAF